MASARCPVCGGKMKGHGKTSSGKKRWQCMSCGATTTRGANTDARTLSLFLSWLLSKKTQSEMGMPSRTFRDKTAKFWSIWPTAPVCDEVHHVVHVNGNGNESANANANTNATENTASGATVLTSTDDNGVKLTIEAAEGVLPAGTTLKAEALTGSDVESMLKDVVPSGKQLAGFVAYDVTLSDAQGNTVEPAGSVKVTIEDSAIQAENAIFVHATSELKEANIVSEGKIEADIDHFSVVALAEIEDIPAQQVEQETPMLLAATSSTTYYESLTFTVKWNDNADEQHLRPTAEAYKGASALYLEYTLDGGETWTALTRETAGTYVDYDKVNTALNGGLTTDTLTWSTTLSYILPKTITTSSSTVNIAYRVKQNYSAMDGV